MCWDRAAPTPTLSQRSSCPSWTSAAEQRPGRASCRAVRRSVWRLRGRSPLTPRCCSWMNRPPHSIRRAAVHSARRYAGCANKDAACSSRRTTRSSRGSFLIEQYNWPDGPSGRPTVPVDAKAPMPSRWDAGATPALRAQLARNEDVHHAVSYHGDRVMRLCSSGHQLRRARRARSCCREALHPVSPAKKPGRPRQHGPDVRTQPSGGAKPARQVSLAEKRISERHATWCQETSRLERAAQLARDDTGRRADQLLERRAGTTHRIEWRVVLAASPFGKGTPRNGRPVVPVRFAMPGQDDRRHAAAVFARRCLPRTLKASQAMTTAGSRTTKAS